MPGFVCPGCRKCSLEDFFSKNGCASAGSKATELMSFPFLNVSHLSQTDKVVLENKLIEEYRKIEGLFRVFVSNLASTFSGDFEKFSIV